jgi:hypothetical protein
MQMDDKEADATTKAAGTTAADSTTNPALETASNDLDGLFEASRALADEGRASKLARRNESANELKRELAGAADAYAATVMATLHGNLDMERIRLCREAALDAMPTAARRRKELAALVSERRLTSPEVRNDVRELLSLSLHCRTALDALGPTVDKRAAAAIGNKVLVELREATLLYLANARHAGDGTTDKARSTVVSHLEKTESHVKGFEALALDSTGESADTLGVSLSRDIAAGLHRTHLSWAPNSDHSAG